MRENTDQNNSEYGHFSRSVLIKEKLLQNDFPTQQLNTSKKFIEIFEVLF